MPTISEDHRLTGDERPNPILWFVTVLPDMNVGITTDVSDDAMHYALGPGKSRALKSFGHDDDGVHFLLLRNGTPGLHTDIAYARYTHQLVIRNDGTRVRGLAAYDDDWHPPMYPGAMYCLDTWSPHTSHPDPRMNPALPRTGFMKAVIAVDRDEPLNPAEAWRLLARYTSKQFRDFEVTRRPPRGAAAHAGG
jgi:hypothetical protein